MRTLVLALLLALSPHTASAESITAPVDIGLGPAAYVISGPVANDQPLHTGLKLSIQAIIDQATLRAHQDRIPASVRQQALHMKEVRISPSLLIPDSLIISPKLNNTGLYGITWQPISMSLSLVDAGPFTLNLGTGLLLTYAYLYSDVLPTTHFIRPGLDVGAEAEIALSSSFLISLGWDSGFYVPQGMGEFGLGPFGDKQNYDTLKQTMWHFGQAFVKFHVRFPYTTTL